MGEVGEMGRRKREEWREIVRRMGGWGWGEGGVVWV